MIKFIKRPYKPKVSYIPHEWVVSIKETPLGVLREYLPRLSWPDKDNNRFPIEASFEVDIIGNTIKNFKTFEEAKEFILLELKKLSEVFYKENLKDISIELEKESKEEIEEFDVFYTDLVKNYKVRNAELNKIIKDLKVSLEFNRELLLYYKEAKKESNNV